MNTDEQKPETKPVGVFVTLSEIYKKVEEIDGKLTTQLNRVNMRLAAHEAVFGILLLVIGALIQKGFMP